jgi:hypothetical protein
MVQTRNPRRVARGRARCTAELPKACTCFGDPLACRIITAILLNAYEVPAPTDLGCFVGSNTQTLLLQASVCVGAVKPKLATEYPADAAQGLGFKERRLARLLAEALAALAQRNFVDCGRYFITNYYLGMGGLTKQTLVRCPLTSSPTHTLHVWSGGEREVCFACLKHSLHMLNKLASRQLFEFASADYWDSKQRDTGTDEWYLGFADLQHFLRKLCTGSTRRYPQGALRILVPGCGNSTFCEECVAEFAHVTVIATDIAPEVIQHQQACRSRLPLALQARLVYSVDDSTSSVCIRHILPPPLSNHILPPLLSNHIILPPLLLHNTPSSPLPGAAL